MSKFKRSKISEFSVANWNEHVRSQRTVKANMCCPQCGFSAKGGFTNDNYISTTKCPTCNTELLSMGYNYRVPSKKRKAKFQKHITNVQIYGINM